MRTNRQLTPPCLILAALIATTAVAASQSQPDSSGPDWKPLFAADLADADKPAGVWSVENGELTASADQAIWTKTDYENFTLDLEFKTAPGTNSGVILYCTDTTNWIPKSVEVQIADPFADEWAKAAPSWHGGGIFGHLPPAKQVTKKPGEWNHMTIQATGKQLTVWLNGEITAAMDMARWTSAKTNPDGTEIPPWLSTPFAELPTKGRIGLQGKHGHATVWFRNVRIKSAKPDLPESPAKTKANQAKSQATASALELAINNFFADYGALPDVGVQVKTDSGKGIKLLEILLGLEGESHKVQNARGVKFLAVKETKTKTNGLQFDASGKSVVGLYDAWGNPFTVALDTIYEDRVSLVMGSKLITLKGRKCAIYSPGPDKKFGTDDDVKTW